jgi:hypothetical protein
MLAVGWTCEIRVCIRVMRHGRLGTIDGADRLAILTLDACHVQTVGSYYATFVTSLNIPEKEGIVTVYITMTPALATSQEIRLSNFTHEQLFEYLVVGIRAFLELQRWAARAGRLSVSLSSLRE